MPTRVIFDNDSSERWTILDIETEDRLGLLYLVSKLFSESHIDISLAKISTEKGAAVDTFYIAEEDGQKITAPERQLALEEKLILILKR
jgi:[protein-PII] uridylyltransferase